MTEQPDPGPGWRIASGNDWKDERCERWGAGGDWFARDGLLKGSVFLPGLFYRIPIDEPKPDLVNAPPHYRQGGLECIDAIRAALTEEEFRGFVKGNAIKYCWREKHKGGDQDLQKAAWYLERLAKEKTE